MRLICPNCDAQYEVPDGVMPEEGRDVQCSNCGHTWFQEHPDHATDFSGDDGDMLLPQSFPEQDDADPDDEVERVEEPVPEPKSTPRHSPEPEPAAPAAPSRRSIDPGVADILRHEAEIEARARRNADPEWLESQPDLGLDALDDTADASRRSHEARSRMARMRGEDPEDVRAGDPAAAGSRRDLLPDIEEINSTLRSSSDRVASGDPTELAAEGRRQTRNSRRGFTWAILLAAILALIYVYAPQLAEAVPQLDPWISGYVTAVDNARLWLDEQIKALLGWLDAAANSTSR